MEELAKAVFEKVKDKFKGEWDTLSDESKDALKEATLDFTKLQGQQLLGKDVDAELALVEATLKNFQVAGQLRTREVLLESFEEVAGLLVGLARKALLG